MSELPHEDPVAHASTRIASYVSVAAMAAQAVAQVTAARAAQRAAADERAAGALRAEHRAAYSQARLGWASVLDPKLRGRADVAGAGTAWAHAQAWRPDPEAERASHLAEERLRELRPDVMDRYDRLRNQGSDPVEAMRRVAPFFDRPPARPGQAAPERAVLDQAGSGRGSADSETGAARGGAAAGAEQAAAAGQERPQLPAQVVRSGSQDGAAQTVVAVTARTAAELAADGYPTPLHSVTAGAARAAAAGQSSGAADLARTAREQAATTRSR